jgi:hypothetical protein
MSAGGVTALVLAGASWRVLERWRLRTEAPKTIG